MRRILILIAVSLAAWILAWLWWRDPATRGQAVANRADLPTSRPPSVTRQPVSSTLTANVERDQPLMQVAGVLREAAASGDGAAGCRLAMELVRCLYYRRDLDSLRNKANVIVPDAEARKSMEAGFAFTQKQVDRLRPICEGVAAGSEREVWRLLLAAAKAGHVRSMTKFGAGTGLRSLADQEFDLEGFAAYRMYAHDLLTQAAAAGEPRAFLILGEGYLRASTGTPAIPYDPVRGVAYLKALVRNLGRDAVGAASTLKQLIAREHVSAADQLRAEVLATELEAPLRQSAPLDLIHADLENREPDLGCSDSARK
jgi:hypothetical protein